MKRKLFLVLLFPIAIVLANEEIPLNKAVPAKTSLPDAYARAMTALGEETNAFHCLSANVITDFSPDGGWQFTFYSTNAKPKWITVEFNGKLHVEDLINR